jgi:DNA (cytosine-5)-methyltransferase 1
VSLTVTDLFCGAGGSSIGAEVAGATLRLGLNHWDRAIETHATNFQHADHDCEDVSSLTTAQIRRYPDSDILLASPECTNHSLAKGSRRRKPQRPSLFDDGPAGDDEQDRSRATMWDVVRFAEQKLLKGREYKAIVVENVVDAFNWGYDDDGGLFDSWLMAMRALGYEHEIVWLNSMFCPPTPQSRDRMYVVFWRKGIKAPNLRFEPPGWCPACEAIVIGRQSFKRQRRGRNWGRYGPQYLYRCPDCAGAILPGAFPAATAIDWALPAQLIGERVRPLAEATRERIRRGLERLANEPFAIRLLQSGNPKPLTLPLVTLTQRHDMAMVMPVAGNTFERTPGNRARDADRQPLDTVHGTLDRALVLSNRANNVPRKAGAEPTHPLLTGSHQAVVVPQEKHTTPRIADVDQLHTVKAGGQHHALVMRNNESRGDSGAMCTPADREPVRTLTTSGHQSVILVPYNGSEARDAEREPSVTLHTRDPLALAIGDEDIDSCRFRMFELHEIAEAMAMHEHVDGSNYIVVGNKRERMAQYGNAVTPPAMRELVGRLVEVL